MGTHFLSAKHTMFGGAVTSSPLLLWAPLASGYVYTLKIKRRTVNQGLSAASADTAKAHSTTIATKPRKLDVETAKACARL